MGKSAAWQLGLLMWEIFSISENNSSSSSVSGGAEMMRMDPETQALGKPRGCPSGVYELMVDCLDMEPMRRPSFQEIESRLKVLVQQLQPQLQQQQHQPQQQQLRCILEYNEANSNGGSPPAYNSLLHDQ